MWKSCLFVMLCALASGVAADETGRRGPTVAQLRQGDDLYMAGGTLTLNQPVAGDLLVSAGTADVDTPVAGEVLAVGGKLRLGADVGQSVHAAGAQLTVNGKVGRNLRMAAGQVELGPQSEVAGNVMAVGGQLRLYGSVKGQVHLAGGRVLLDGPVSGDVTASAGQIELGPRARIAGKLYWRSRQALRQDPAAQVGGGIERLALPAGQRDDDDDRADRRGGRAALGAVAWVWTLGLILLAWALLAVLPGFTGAASRTLRQRPGASLLLGFAWLVCVPVAVVLLLVTLIGIPLGLFGLAVYLALMPVAYVGTAIGLGDWALGQWVPERAQALSLRMGATASALVILTLLCWIPVLGVLVGLLALLLGLGAWVRQGARTTLGAAA